MTSKTFIVTGASRGIGRSITLILLKNFSNNVLAIARSKDDLSNLKQHVEVDLNLKDKLEIVVGDVTEETTIDEAINKCLNKWKRIDGVVSNAGIIEPIAKIFDANIQDWKRCFDVNFFSNILLVQKVLPHLHNTIKNGGDGGNMIFVSTGAAIKAYYGWGAYSASKAALNMLVSNLSIEEDITSIAIRPGVVDTAMQQYIREKGSNAMSKSDHETFIKLHEGSKLLSPDEPGYVISSLINSSKNEIHKFNGSFVSWDDKALNNFSKK